MGYVVRPCVWESSGGWLVARNLYECVLMRSSTLLLLPFTLDVALRVPHEMC